MMKAHEVEVRRKMDLQILTALCSFSPSITEELALWFNDKLQAPNGDSDNGAERRQDSFGFC